MGLPNVLEKLLDTLSGTNEVRTWNIFQDKNGTVVVKIRFSGQDGSSGSGVGQLPVSYKRKSTKQMQRDSDRAKQHSQGMQTRSRTKMQGDIENARSGDISLNSDLLPGMSPICPEESINSDLFNSSPLLPDHSHASVDQHTNNPNQLIFQNINTTPHSVTVAGTYIAPQDAEDIDSEYDLHTSLRKDEPIEDQHTQYPCRHRDNNEPPDHNNCFMCEKYEPKYKCNEPACKGSIKLCEDCFVQRIPECCHKKHRSLITPIT